jgi:3-hydroxyisobutyrate dehydrogenase-like beta-hydroxyacid dehydrogenase
LARCLIIGCGCRGRALGGELVARGHAVRGTTRDPARRRAIEAIGAEAFVGDPDVVGTLAPALEHVTVACLLLGSASASPAGLAALHGTRLEMLLSRMLDTTVRGIVYEAAGSVDPLLLRGGAMQVRARCEDSRIPYAMLDADPADPREWNRAAIHAVESVLSPR